MRPCNNLEGSGIIVWVYHRKVQVQLAFEHYDEVEDCIRKTVAAWRYAMEIVK